MQRAADELLQLVAKDAATPETITALRQSREALTRELAPARGLLQQVLTISQEATLVLMGILE